MKKRLFLAMCFLAITLLPVNIFAYRVDLTSHENLPGQAWVDVIGDGTNRIYFELGLEAGAMADIRALWFDTQGVWNTSDILIKVTGVTDENKYFTTSGEHFINWLDPDLKTSASTNMAGTKFDFDLGLEFGKQGIGSKDGDIRSVAFYIESTDNLTLGTDFGMRLTSFGEDREDSRKMIVSYASDSLATIHNPEPTTMILFGLGLLGFAGIKRNKAL